jgi:predicted transglutaminase-like cysteine proteinase
LQRFPRSPDYVLQKRRILSEEGVALSNLLITVVRKPDGEGHAVLTVRTDEGDFVLDNLRKAVLPWDETGYRYLKRQASDHTGRWVSILDGDEPLVGSVD